MTPCVIQIVDDDPMVRESLAALLESYGFEARVFESGEAYLAGSGASNGLFLDINLPGLNGFEIFDRAAAMVGRDRIVLMSAAIDRHMQRQANLRGAATLLQKPLAPATVLAVAARFGQPRA